MKRIQGFLLGLIVTIALPALAYKVTDANIIFGTNGDVTLRIGGGQIKWNNTLGTLEKSNDGGVTSEELGTAGKVKFDKSQTLELHTGAGFGSTNTIIRYFSGTGKESGGGIFTHNHGGTDSINGLELTFLKNARLEGVYCEQSNNTWSPFGITTNANPLISINSLTYSTGLRGKTDVPTGDDYKCFPFDFDVLSGEVVRPHTHVGASTLIASNSPYISFKATSIETVDSVSLRLAHMKGSIKYNGQALCSWQVATANNVWQDFPLDADCSGVARDLVGDAIDSSSGTLPEFQFNKLEAGHYKLVATGKFGASNNLNANNIFFRANVNGGTIISEEISIFDNSVGGQDNVYVPSLTFSFDVLSTISNPIIKIQGKSPTGGSPLLSEIQATFNDFKLTLYYFPQTTDSEILIPLQIGKSSEWSSFQNPAGYSSGNTFVPYYSTTSINTFNQLAVFTNDPINGLTITALQKIRVEASASLYATSTLIHMGWVYNPTLAEMDASILSAGPQSKRVGTVQKLFDGPTASGISNSPVTAILNIGERMSFQADGAAISVGDPNVGGYVVASPADIDGVIAKNAKPRRKIIYEKNNVGTSLPQGVWSIVHFNTESGDNIASLSNNEILLKAGNYMLSGTTRFYMSVNAQASTSFRLYNVTDAVSYSDDLGTCISYPISATYGGALRDCTFTPTFIFIQSDKVFRIEAFPSGGSFSNGSGNVGVGGVTSVRSHISIIEI